MWICFGHPRLYVLWFWYKICSLIDFWGRKKKIENLVFGRSGLNSCVFEKLLNSYSCISFMKYVGLSGFCIKFSLFFKTVTFPYFRSIEVIAWPIEIAIKILVWICLAQSVLDWCSIDRIYLFDQSKLNFDGLKFESWVF